MPPTTMVLETDGSSRGNPGKAGAGYVLSMDGKVVAEEKRHLGITTNNVAEYEAAIAAVEKARELGLRDIRLELDSELVVRQLTGAYRVRDSKLIALHDRLRTLFGTFAKASVTHVPRSRNRRADELANLAVDEAAEGGTGNPPSPGPEPRDDNP